MNLKSFECILPKECILINEPMSKHTTFKTGGPADILFVPRTEEQLVLLLRTLREEGTSPLLIGRGSNLLVSDAGIRGVVVKVSHGGISHDGNMLHANAGISLRALAQAAAQSGLTGLEFASGIPGTLGGGIVMNAGAYGGELKDTLVSVCVLDRNLYMQTVSNAELNLSYRSSVIEKKGFTVLSASFLLAPDDPLEIFTRMEKLAAFRRTKQPLEFPSAGSIFKRPQGYFAATLIDQCGLKGKCIGGAQVSNKHAGFIINIGDACSTDIYRLICMVQNDVFDQTGILLIPEVRFLGEFDI
jgi:UDP-N-acetylmuramate dehydrogenase